MKIYCGRQRNESDEDIFNSLIGTDTWVKVRYPEHNTPWFLYLNILSSYMDDDGELHYIAYRWYRDPVNAVGHPTEVPESLVDSLFVERDIAADSIVLMRPVDMLSNDELFTIVPNSENEG